MMQHLKKFSFLVCVLVFFTACDDKAIVHDLAERDANEILVVLAKSGITAMKEKEEKNQEISWVIKVKKEDEMQARGILVANRLPRVKHGGLSGICKEAGLILTPKTEKCREILAYKGEIINSLESIPGVVSADVVLNVPDKEEFPDENSPPPRPTASVTVRYLKDNTMTDQLTEGKVQEFVANAVSGLDARDVTVIISFENVGSTVATTSVGTTTTVDGKTSDDTSSATDTDIPQVTQPELASIGGLKMDEDSAKKFKLVAVMFLVLFLILTAAFIFVLLRLAKAKKQSVSATVEDGEEDDEQKLLEAGA